jgi:hypothetical protein
MKLQELAKVVGVEIRVPGRGLSVDVDGVYAGDRVSDLLNAAGDHVLLVSNLASSHLIRVAELMDVPGICLVGGQVPDPVAEETAREHGTVLLVSPVGLFETCGRMYQCLAQEQRVAP